jgi:plasmid stabilization system protein ParE
VRSLKIEFSPDALEQIRAIHDWWRTHRAAAPELLREELAATLEMIRSSPKVAKVYSFSAIPGLRRTLMPRTRYTSISRFTRSGRSSSCTPFGTQHARWWGASVIFRNAPNRRGDEVNVGVSWVAEIVAARPPRQGPPSLGPLAFVVW